MKVDVVIVGARCAGAATALLLARAGARVLVVDRGAYGTDTLSTHALMRGAVLQLHRWGVLPAVVATGTPAVTSTTFDYEHDTVTVPSNRSTASRRCTHHAGCCSTACSRPPRSRAAPRWPTACGWTTSFATTPAGSRRHRDVPRRPSSHRRRTGHRSRRACIPPSRKSVGAERLVEGRHATGSLYTYWRGCPSTATTGSFRPGLLRRRHPHQRRRHLRGGVDVRTRASAPRSVATPRRPTAGSFRRSRRRVRRAAPGRRAADGADPRVRRLSWLHQARGRPGLGAGGRRRLLQGSDDRARHHRRPA